LSVDVTLLGTGGGAGWPHPFCTCASCAAAAAEGEIRAHTSALIDGVLLVDCGQDVPRSAVRLGVRLDGVRHLLVTHDHHDHANGAALLWRRWAGCTGPLEVIGPRAALDSLAQWLPPDDPGVDFTPVVAGDVVELGDYTVRVLAAEHDSEGAVIYDVADAAHRLLYATDTGPGFSTPLRAHYDLLLLENSWGESPAGEQTRHHDLASFASTLARLRRENAIDDRTRVIAVHLGHGNPAPSVLRARLMAMGAELVPDGFVIRLGDETAGLPATRRSTRAQRILVLGGARSGKSVTAERLLAADPHVTYVATAAHAPDDDEWSDRVAAHRGRRPAGWTTLETAAQDVDGLAELLAAREPADAPLLIDCLTLWLAHVMDVVGVWTAADDVATKAADVELATAVDALVQAWRTTRGDVVAVSNEVGSGVVPDYPSGRRFRDELGGLNARLAAASDDVLFVEAGISRSLFPHRINPHQPPESS
jgi:adenosylcobinamide kinase / adenosylcobinamide-phosphate guanylyltransferase